MFKKKRYIKKYAKYITSHRPYIIFEIYRKNILDILIHTHRLLCLRNLRTAGSRARLQHNIHIYNIYFMIFICWYNIYLLICWYNIYLLIFSSSKSTSVYNIYRCYSLQHDTLWLSWFWGLAKILPHEKRLCGTLPNQSTLVYKKKNQQNKY